MEALVIASFLKNESSSALMFFSAAISMIEALILFREDVMSSERVLEAPMSGWNSEL